MTNDGPRMTNNETSSPLDAFLPAVQTWFHETFGEPTPPQAMGWPAIQRGEHTLILSPTGSGKTLAAFLWGIDQLYRETLEQESQETGESREEGVRLLYVSPLKALNNDVERNLRAPLAGIRRVAEEQGAPLPRLSVLVRTGDTPQSVRRRMVKQPPHVLITTPESLYLILTSPVAREMFRTVRTLIVDEIHTLVGNKRGVHLAVSLERVVELAGHPIQRIGLSATQRPLDEVARFLGGYESQVNAERGTPSGGLGDPVPRPVTIVDAGMVKPMDLKVVTAVEDFSDLPGGSIWPAIIPQVMDLIEAHRTTLIFANSRRQAERAADRLNDLYLARQAGRAGGPEAMMEGGAVKGLGIQGTGAPGGPFNAHHGSVSREARLQLEQALKAGRLPALVGTSSLELGIDIGAVDLVVQLQSPKGVARGLQRVGRSGHLVGQTSEGRFFPTHREDVLEMAAIARAMVQGDVEPTYAPQNSLDVLAQQIVAMVSVQDWDAPALLDLIRRAYPYHKLTLQLYHAVLDMLTGRYPSTAFRELRPRIAWDRVHNRLTALPGSRLLAIRNGGTIPDRGTFAAYLPDRKTRLGELDEEFVFETHPGDVFTLGASTWRVQEVTDDRVIVTPAPGYLPRMPFWKGDAPRRDYHLGVIYGRFRRELAERIAQGTRERMAADGAHEVVDRGLRSRGCPGGSLHYGLAAGRLPSRHPLGAERGPLRGPPDGRTGHHLVGPDRHRRDVHRSPGRPAAGDPLLLWGAGEQPLGAGPVPGLSRGHGPARRAGTQARGHGQRRWHPLPLPGDRPRTAPGPDPRDGAGRGPGAAAGRAARLGRVWRPVSHERRPRPAAARRQGRPEAHALLAAAPAGQGPAVGGQGL